MGSMHLMAEMYLYFAVKLPLYAYESIDDMKESLPYYRVMREIVWAKIRRIL